MKAGREALSIGRAWTTQGKGPAVHTQELNLGELQKEQGAHPPTSSTSFDLRNVAQDRLISPVAKRLPQERVPHSCTRPLRVDIGGRTDSARPGMCGPRRAPELRFSGPLPSPSPCLARGPWSEKGLLLSSSWASSDGRSGRLFPGICHRQCL